MKMQAVKSSFISKVGHDGDQTMRIEFYDGDTWEYSPVEEDQFLNFKTAPSIGRHFHQHIGSNTNITARKIK